MNTIRLERAIRRGGAGQTERTFLDICVDGRSLVEEVRTAGHDLMTPLGCGWTELHTEAVDRLLLRRRPDLPSDRVALFVCPECADLDCGAIGMKIERKGESVAWRAFAWVGSLGRARTLPNIGPFEFDWTEYVAIFTGANPTGH